MKKKIAFIILSGIICGGLASCGEKPEKSAGSSSEKPQIVTESVGGIELEDRVNALTGDAYLAIAAGDWQVQYMGLADDGEKPAVLAYDAGIAKVTGSGDYTVSVTADTKGYRYEMTGDIENTTNTPAGISFMAVMIKDGEKEFPGGIITVNSVKVDGKEITMTAKPYTSSDDDIETRANIYNTYVGSRPTKDARTADGALYDGNTPLPACEDYAPVAVSADDFRTWQTVEVSFHFES